MPRHSVEEVNKPREPSYELCGAVVLSGSGIFPDPALCGSIAHHDSYGRSPLANDEILYGVGFLGVQRQHETLYYYNEARFSDSTEQW